MKRLIQFFIIIAFLPTFNIANAGNLEEEASPLVGHWIFNKNETIENFINSEMTSEEVERFSSILKPAEIIITEDVYSTFLLGRKSTHTNYSIVSVFDGGQCYKLQFKGPRIPLDIQINEMCVINDKLFLLSVKGSKEVFERKI